MRRSLALVLGVIFVGCSSPPGSTSCLSAADCPTGQSCVAGRCASSAMDAGGDTGIDSAVRPDAAAPDGAGPDGGTDASACDAIVTCTTGEQGACGAGHLDCVHGGCRRDHEPTTETCDTVDQDCDGRVDEESGARCYPTTAIGCMARPDGTFACTGLCAPGTAACSGGVIGACAGAVTPGTEVCQTGSALALDEDCDGTIDEGCFCTLGAMRPCFDGPAGASGVGPCRSGTQQCSLTSWGACTGAVLPHAETCSNQTIDDDCNGRLDDVAGLGATCAAPPGGIGACATGMLACASGSLACAAPTPHTETCDHGDDDCDGSIDETFSLDTDVANCGACGVACGAGQSCCGGHCIDASTDEANCGACGTSCGADGTCCGRACIDSDVDPMNCGACGNVCTGSQMCCAGTCIDPLVDESNCSACGMHCTGASSACCGGTCRPPTAPQCTGCAVDCSTQTPPSTCCGSSCVDRMTDEQHCGTCGHACSAGQVCCAGACVADDPSHCGGACTDCGGGLCCGGACVPSDTRHCGSCSATCGPGTTCCADGCHDLAHDATHCGACTTACTGSMQCSNAHCCPSGQTYCGSACSNTATDNANCGFCGHACSGLNTCRAGVCTLL